MIEFMAEIRSGIDNFNTGGQYLILYLGSLLFLYVTKPKEHRDVRNYALFIIGLVLFPLTAYVLVWYRTGYYNYDSLWGLLPITMIIALGLTEVSETLWKKLCEQKKWKCYAAVLGVVLLVALCGTVSAFHTKQEESNGFVKISTEEIEVLEVLRQQEGWKERCVWAPDKVLESARAYDGGFKLLYGRDLWNLPLRGYTFDGYDESREKLYTWMNINWYEVQVHSLEVELSAEEAFYLAKECGCDILVLDKMQLEAGEIYAFLKEKDQNLLNYVTETEKYIIYEYIR